MERRKHEHDLYAIKSLTAMNFLVREGFDVVVISKDNANINKVVFLFEDTPEFRKVLTKYSELKKQRKLN